MHHACSCAVILTLPLSPIARPASAVTNLAKWTRKSRCVDGERLYISQKNRKFGM